jgi:uncharacterized damage-inducible protein DinB
MPGRRVWFQRRFELGLPAEAFPDVLERVRGTPARLEERVRGLEFAKLTARTGDRWSIQEHVGHLLDLEELWAGRLDELMSGDEQLRAADLENRKTYQANHNDRLIDELLAEFRAIRMEIVSRLESLSHDDLRRQSLHPRLQQPMTAVDLFFFVAEHDDHHLACITEILRLGPVE